SLLNLNWSDLSWFQHFNAELNEETALAYFCQIGNPFYDRSSLNEQIYIKNLPVEAMVRDREISSSRLKVIFYS
ncbi:unnamed protein product, partial [Rotaria magnacalcarata]